MVLQFIELKYSSVKVVTRITTHAQHDKMQY